MAWHQRRHLHRPLDLLHRPPRQSLLHRPADKKEEEEQEQEEQVLVRGC